MKAVVKRLNEKRAYHEIEAGKCAKAIEVLQDVCDHKWASDGHDSRHNYKKCTECGRREQC